MFKRSRFLFAFLATFTFDNLACAGNGVIATIGGNGQDGYSGDNGVATVARLSFPIRAVVASDGGILIADEGNNVIRYIRPDGTIKTEWDGAERRCADLIYEKAGGVRPPAFVNTAFAGAASAESS